MELETLGTLQVGPGGWVLFEARDLPAPIYARFGLAAGGRLEVRELYIATDGRLSPGALRQLAAHFPNLEMLANVPAFRENIVGRLGEPGADLRRLAAYFAPTWATSRPERHPDHWIARSYLAQFPDSGEPQAPMPRRRRWRPQTVPVPHFKVEVPSTVPYPDDFYRQVADAYRFLALVSPRPAVELADANGVPPSTTRRWVKEARRRGVLAPGQKGRRG